MVLWCYYDLAKQQDMERTCNPMMVKMIYVESDNATVIAEQRAQMNFHVIPKAWSGTDGYIRENFSRRNLFQNLLKKRMEQNTDWNII